MTFGKKKSKQEPKEEMDKTISPAQQALDNVPDELFEAAEKAIQEKMKKKEKPLLGDFSDFPINPII